MSDGGMSRRKYPFQWGHCPFTGVLALSAEIVDDRPCVVHLRRSPASWMNAQSLYINHCWRKMCGLNKQKNGCHRKVPWAIAISQQSSTPIKLPILKNSRRRSRTFWNNWTRTNSKNRKHFRQFGSFKVIKNGAIRQITYDFLFDFQNNYMPICLSFCFGCVTKIQSTKLVAMATPLEGLKNNTSDRLSKARVLPSLPVA